MSVFRWTSLLAGRASQLQQQVQKEYLLRGFLWQLWLRLSTDLECPNGQFAHSTAKRIALNALRLLVAMAQLFFGVMAGALEQLHAYFLKDSESAQLIFTGGDFNRSTHHRMGRAF